MFLTNLSKMSFESGRVKPGLSRRSKEMRDSLVSNIMLNNLVPSMSIIRNTINIPILLALRPMLLVQASNCRNWHMSRIHLSSNSLLCSETSHRPYNARDWGASNRVYVYINTITPNLFCPSHLIASHWVNADDLADDQACYIFEFILRQVQYNQGFTFLEWFRHDLCLCLLFTYKWAEVNSHRTMSSSLRVSVLDKPWPRI